MNVLKSIYNILAADASVTGITSTRIYPAVVPQKIADPFIEFDCYNTEPTDTKTSASILDTYFVEVSCYHTSALQAVTLSNYVRAALDRYTGLNAGNVIDKSIFDSQDGPYFDHERELYRVDINFRIRVKMDATNPAASYTMSVAVYFNDVLVETVSIDPLINNTINIS
jgi:hypothetical protein